MTDPDFIRIPIEETLDLHSIPPAETRAVVEEYLVQARKAGFREVRIIHGRGRGVQRAAVQSLLARMSLVAAFRDAPPSRGGFGATVAWLIEPEDPEEAG